MARRLRQVPSTLAQFLVLYVVTVVAKLATMMMNFRQPGMAGRFKPTFTVLHVQYGGLPRSIPC